MACMSTHEILASPTKYKGQIQVIFGPMFSGKTTELMRRLKRYQVAKYKCLIVKYAKDQRYDQNAAATHDKQTMEAVAANTLSNMDVNQVNVVGVDEGQFFPDCVRMAEKWADSGKIVIIAALDGTFQRQPFGNILELVPLAENVVKLSAVCMNCFSEAAYTKRLGSETRLELIGGVDKYLAACRSCHPSHSDSNNPVPKANNFMVDRSSPGKNSAFPTIRGLAAARISPSKATRKLFNSPSTGVTNDVAKMTCNTVAGF